MSKVCQFSIKHTIFSRLLVSIYRITNTNMITVQDIHTKLLWTVSLCLHDVLTTATDVLTTAIHSLVCLQPALPLLCPYSCTWAVAEFKSLHSWLNYLRVIIQVIRNTHPVRKYNYLTPNDAYMCTIIGTTHNWCIKCHRTCMQFPNNVTIVWNNTYLKGVNPEKDF